jgi:hypothetical protein
MLGEILTILSGYGQSTVDKIRQNMSTTGTDASGESSRSLTFEVTESGSKATLRVKAKPYFMVVETGRKPTPEYTKPSESFVDRIKSWLTARGKDQGAAYAIAKNIHKEGTKLWQTGGRTDIVSNVVNPSLVEEISRSLLKDFAKTYLVSVANTFRDGNRN